MKQGFLYLVILVALGSFVFTSDKANAFDVNQCNQQEKEADCKKRLDELEKEIKKLEGNIKSENQNQQKLTTEISKLNSNIQQTSAEINRKNKLIQNLKGEITGKQETIEELNKKLKRDKESLADILRQRDQVSDATILELILSSEQISDFYQDLSAYSSVQNSLSDTFAAIESLKKDIYGEKEYLEMKQKEEDAAKYALQLEKNKIEDQKKDRDTALSVSKQTSAGYEQLKKAHEEEIKKIRAEMIKFQGSGINSKPISFGEAYDFAKFAEQKTGVSAAFLIAIMQQETGLGQNVGGCYITDLTTGDGKGINTGAFYEKVMGTGSLPHFSVITKNLGLDWQKTPVSCPIDMLGVGTATKYYQGRGYGGAMGYTQFIPSTWVLVEARVKANLGVAVANPWDPKHAVMAAAVYAKDLGASGSTVTNYNSYVNAACRYFGQCGGYSSPVMTRTANNQAQIDILEKKN